VRVAPLNTLYALGDCARGYDPLGHEPRVPDRMGYILVDIFVTRRKHECDEVRRKTILSSAYSSFCCRYLILSNATGDYREISKSRSVAPIVLLFRLMNVVLDWTTEIAVPLLPNKLVRKH
jgi:hypothetical protein